MTEIDELPDGGRRFTAVLSPAWEIWGPMGGYLASVAMRAAGAASPFDRPASFFCHYLSVARFDEVTIDVRPLRTAKTAVAQRVEVSQDDRLMLDATVWSVGDVDGLAHDVTAATRPEVPQPRELPDITEPLTDGRPPPGPTTATTGSSPRASTCTSPSTTLVRRARGCSPTGTGPSPGTGSWRGMDACGRRTAR